MSAADPACETSAAPPAEPGAKPLHPRLVLAVSILASSLAFVDGSVVNVGLSAIGRSLSARPDILPWVVDAYLLPLSALLLLGGSAGDRFGRRRLLIGGVLLFGLASLACALAPSLPFLLGGRLVQGVGAAMLMPNSLAILGQTFSGEAKGRAIGVWAATAAMAGAVGPVLGGALIDLVSWRAIFLLNLPLAAGAVFLALRYVPPDEAGRDQPLDASGGVLATLGLGALTWSLIVGTGKSGWTPASLGAAAAAIALLGAFVLVERRRGERAMMPLSLFASRTFVGLSLFTLCLYGALGGLLVLIPYVLIKSSGYAATAAGAALLPLPLVLSVASPAMGGLAGRVGSRLPLSIAPLVVGAGFLMALRIGAGVNYWTGVLPAMLLIAVGMSGAAAPLTTAVLSSVDPRHTGSASGFNSAVARTGGLIATALLAFVLAAPHDRLIAAFHAAMLAGAAACLLASAGAFLLIDKTAGAPQP